MIGCSAISFLLSFSSLSLSKSRRGQIRCGFIEHQHHFCYEMNSAVQPLHQTLLPSSCKQIEKSGSCNLLSARQLSSTELTADTFTEKSGAANITNSAPLNCRIHIVLIHLCFCLSLRVAFLWNNSQLVPLITPLMIISSQLRNWS